MDMYRYRRLLSPDQGFGLHSLDSNERIGLSLGIVKL